MENIEDLLGKSIIEALKKTNPKEAENIALKK